MAVAPCSSISTVLLLLISIIQIIQAGSGNHDHKVEDADLCSWSACRCTPENHSIECNFNATQIVNLAYESIKLDIRHPGSIQEIHLRGAKKIYIQNISLYSLDVLFVGNVEYVEFQPKSCFNLRPNNLKVIVDNCTEVHLRTSSLQIPDTGIMTVNISNCHYVNIESKTFSRVLSVHLNQIHHLKLEKSAFHVIVKDRIITKIYLNRVLVPNFPERTFVVNLSEIMIDESRIEVITKDAFNANEYHHIKINNTVIGTIEEEGFSYNSLIRNFTFYNCTIKHMKPNAIKASSTCFKIQHSNLKNIERGAINSSSAEVTISDNTIDTFSIEMDKWNTFKIERNRFNNFKNNSIIAPYNCSEVLNKFTFVNNSIDMIENDSLRFVRDLPGTPMLEVCYENIYFNKLCSCDNQHWLENVLGGNVSSMNIYIPTSYCRVSDDLPKCLNLTQMMTMKMYSQKLCEDNKIFCKDIIIDNKKKHEEQDGGFLYSIRHNETKILIYILLFVGVSVVVIFVAIALCKFVKRRGYCANVKNAVTPSNSSCFTFIDRLFNINYGLDTTESLSRISLNNYTDNLILQERREDSRTLINSTSMEDLIETVDKATQTLPEELTKELLESLREKLDDPDNYNEAREMIEHLYDLIKVEEYCNLNNNNDLTSQVAKAKVAENLYDVIQVPASPKVFQGKNKKIMVSVGVNTSIEKLAIASPYNRQMALCHEYFEPQDHTMHLYSELPDNKYSDIPSQMDLVSEVMSPNPFNYLRAIELSMNGSKAAEKGEPSNVKDNLTPGPSGVLRSATQKSNKSNYSVSSDSSASKMANRPLPEKPRAPP